MSEQFQNIEIFPEDKLALQVVVTGAYVSQRVEQLLERFLQSIDDDITHLPEAVQILIKGIIVLGTVAPIPGSSIVSPVSILLLILIKRQRIHQIIQEIAIKRYL